MKLHPTTPSIPADLLAQYGEPEHVFGPNMQFRVRSLCLGVLLVVLGAAFFVIGVESRVNDRPKDGSSGLMVMLAAGLMAVGAGAVVFPRSVPLNWIFVCPGGLVRTRGEEWLAIAWSDVSRFENADLSDKAVTIRQCRIITSSGEEVAFSANWIADYQQLTAVLRQKWTGGKM